MVPTNQFFFLGFSLGFFRPFFCMLMLMLCGFLFAAIGCDGWVLS